MKFFCGYKDSIETWTQQGENWHPTEKKSLFGENDSDADRIYFLLFQEVWDSPLSTFLSK